MEVIDQPVFTRRKLRVVGIGAGFSNLTLAYKHKHQGDNSYIDLKIYEKNSSIGGTWFENRYPGAACDVPAHIYCFQFAPNPDWSSFYVSQPEILEYINKTADTYGLRENIQLDSKVTSAVWSEEKGKWQITVKQGDAVIDDEADVLVNGSGFLNSWKWPEIPGLETFKGELVHSADWRDIDLTGKRVGLIGNGSSGVQILPQLQPVAASVDTYVRNPTWIIPNLLGDHTKDGSNYQFSEEEKQRWREHPEELKELRQKLEHAFNRSYPLFLKDHPAQHEARAGFTQMMQARLGGEGTELAKRLIPNFEVGCRRISPGDGYLEALQAENVKVRFEPILSIDEKGIVSRRSAIESEESETTELDVIICATGFDVSFKPHWVMKGHNGNDLTEIWKDDSEAFMGVFAPEMPNYFTATGPNTPIGSGSIFGVIDATADYILKWCAKIASEGIKSVTVKPQVLREYNEYSQLILKTTVWSGSCQSWYKMGGKVRAMYPGSLMHFHQMLAAFRTEDFDIVPLNAKNRFEFMGNGQTQLELTGGNLAYYLTK